MPDPRALALVTGASRGIGAAIAHALAPAHDVLLGGRDRDALERVAAGLPGARAWPVELTDEAALATAVAGIDALDVLVHSAGVAVLGAVADTPAQTWRDQFEVNVVAVAELTRLLLPALRARRGTVVLLNSGAGQVAGRERGAYAASKFALRALADALRAEENPHGVRVTSIFLGRVDTAMQRAVVAFEGGEYRGEDYLSPGAVAAEVARIVTAPAGTSVPEMVLRPSRSGPVRG